MSICTKQLSNLVSREKFTKTQPSTKLTANDQKFPIVYIRLGIGATEKADTTQIPTKNTEQAYIATRWP